MAILPKGKYQARGVEGAAVVAKSGTEGISVIVEIVEGEHARRRLRWDGWLTEKTSQRTIESLRHMGWQGDMLDDLRGIDANIVEIVVDHEEREIEGELKVFPKVEWVNRIGGGAKISDEARMPANAARSLAERFAAQARGVKAASPAPGSKPAAPTSAPAAPRNGGGAPKHAPDAPDFGDDDIPF